jgi:hypothetical protein
MVQWRAGQLIHESAMLEAKFLECVFAAAKRGFSFIPKLIWYCSKKHSVEVEFRPSLLLWPHGIHGRTRNLLQTQLGN